MIQLGKLLFIMFCFGHLPGFFTHFPGKSNSKHLQSSNFYRLDSFPMNTTDFFVLFECRKRRDYAFLFKHIESLSFNIAPSFK
jgi:hypothetical protein